MLLIIISFNTIPIISRMKEDDIIIQLKASTGLKAVFIKLMKTLGTDIKWTEMFVINNNNLILVGSDSVLVFNFGNKMLAFNPYEMHLKEENTLLMTENELLGNVLNMTLYTFGKWGKIKGLTVEKDYPLLNNLFGSILNEIHVEPVLTAESLSFFNDGVKITYEDVIQKVLDKQLKDNTESENADNSNEDIEEDNGKYDKGLWHKIIWKSRKAHFEKEEVAAEDRLKIRIGNNFYMVPYKCPDCGEKLFMVVYPEGKEYRIETDEKGVYLARAYTCATCHQMYTPKPHLLLVDGDVFCIDFEDDSVAYTDYLEVIGKKGERTFNSNFNEYEADLKKENDKKEEQLEEICKEMDSMTDHDVLELQDRMDSGFYPPKSVDKFQNIVEAELKRRQLQYKEKELKEDITEPSKEKQELPVSKSKSTHTEIKSTSDRLKSEDDNSSSRNYETGDSKSRHGRWETGDISKGVTEDNFFPSNNFNADIKPESVLDIVNNSKSKPMISGDKEKELLLKAAQCKDKNYTTILRMIDEINKEEFDQSSKNSILQSLKELLVRKGKVELDEICLKVPENITKAQYIQYSQAIEQYKEIDNSIHKKRLELIRDAAEKREITSYITQANAKDSKSLKALYQKLSKMEFEVRNLAPFLETINEKICAFDEAVIRKICKDPAELTFSAGLKAYEEISAKELLPELKANILSQIDNRLTKIKMNECEHLVNKLTKELEHLAKNQSRIHFYNVRKGLRNNCEDEETQLIIHALNTYADGRGKYEFPIIICDTSLKRNGGRGFIVTPEHIFYNSMIDKGAIDIMKIEQITAMKGLFNTGINVKTSSSSKVKISNSLGLSYLKAFTQILNDFIAYLKEKPESRDISYMAKEKHKVKCCYRCGFVYNGDYECPKCGAKIND